MMLSNLNAIKYGCYISFLSNLNSWHIVDQVHSQTKTIIPRWYSIKHILETKTNHDLVFSSQICYTQVLIFGITYFNRCNSKYWSHTQDSISE